MTNYTENKRRTVQFNRNRTMKRVFLSEESKQLIKNEGLNISQVYRNIRANKKGEKNSVPVYLGSAGDVYFGKRRGTTLNLPTLQKFAKNMGVNGATKTVIIAGFKRKLNRTPNN